RVPIRGGVPEERLRARCRDLDPDDPHRRGPEHLLRAQDDPDGGDRLSDVALPPPKRRRSRRRARPTFLWTSVGVLLSLLLVFPVYWMVSTAFKPDDQINSSTPTWLPLHPTLQHFHDAIHREYFWSSVQNSLVIVIATVFLSIGLAFLAAV